MFTCVCAPCRLLFHRISPGLSRDALRASCARNSSIREDCLSCGRLPLSSRPQATSAAKPSHTTCNSKASTKRFLPSTPAPDKERPFIPVLERTGLSGPSCVKVAENGHDVRVELLLTSGWCPFSTHLLQTRCCLWQLGQNPASVHTVHHAKRYADTSPQPALPEFSARVAVRALALCA